MHGGSPLEKIPLGKDAGRQALERARASLGRIILDKDEQIALALACLLARGHLLIEDLPGLGKTTLAQALAKVLGLSYRRIQFTSDLLPADIVGVSVFRRESGKFEFQPGPIFSQLVLADEVNRATPKAQSALLEAMEEQQVSVDGDTRALPAPFFVVATQNPADQIGTFPLPESQLDRFLMRLGGPTQNARKRNARDDTRGPDNAATGCRQGSHERAPRRLHPGAGTPDSGIAGYRNRLVAARCSGAGSGRPGACVRGAPLRRFYRPCSRLSPAIA
jgi:hypothetical protein